MCSPKQTNMDEDDAIPQSVQTTFFFLPREAAGGGGGLARYLSRSEQSRRLSDDLDAGIGASGC